jgi:hypothetical protein
MQNMHNAQVNEQLDLTYLNMSPAVKYILDLYTSSGTSLVDKQ